MTLKCKIKELMVAEDNLPDVYNRDGHLPVSSDPKAERFPAQDHDVISEEEPDNSSYDTCIQDIDDQDDELDLKEIGTIEEMSYQRYLFFKKMKEHK